MVPNNLEDPSYEHMDNSLNIDSAESHSNIMLPNSYNIECIS